MALEDTINYNEVLNIEQKFFFNVDQSLSSSIRLTKTFESLLKYIL